MFGVRTCQETEEIGAKVKTPSQSVSQGLILDNNPQFV